LAKRRPRRKLDSIYENVISIDEIQESKGKPFRFSGTAFKADTESANSRFYPRSVVETALLELEDGELDNLTIEMGHPSEKDYTSPERIIGGFISLELDSENYVRFIAELNNTRLGKDAQELLRSRPPGTQPLSLRAGGQMVEEKSDGHKRYRVNELHLRGLDLVRSGGFGKDAVVKNVLESDGGEKKMTKDELLAMPEVKELIDSATGPLVEKNETLETEKQALQTEKEELEKEKKEFETKLAEAEVKIQGFEASDAQRKINELIEKSISELEVSDAVKDLLRKRVKGKTEDEVKESLQAELDYIKEVAPLAAGQKSLIIGVPPKDKQGDKPRKKTDEEILKGNSGYWDRAKRLTTGKKE